MEDKERIRNRDFPHRQLTTPENTITYHNALRLSPQNFAQVLFSVSLGAILTPKLICWGDKQRVLWYVMVFSGIVNLKTRRHLKMKEKDVYLRDISMIREKKRYLVIRYYP